MSRPTTDDLTGDHVIAQLARKHWLVRAPSKASAAVPDIWEAVEAEQQFALLLLEQLQALEKYLWPGYSDESSNQHVLLIALLVNVKRAEQLPVWSLFADRPEDFSSFFRRILHLSIDQSLSTKLRTHLLVYLVGAFQSLDSGIVRKECAPLVSIGIWHNLHDEKAIEERLAKSLQVQKAWRAAGKKYDNADAASQARLRFERSWLYTLLLDFLDRLYDVDSSANQRKESLLYCERALELLCDLLSQLPTRRHEYEEAHNASIARLQNVALKIHPEKLKILILANYGSLSQRDELLGHVKALNDVELVELLDQLGLLTAYPEKSLIALDRPFLEEVLASNIEQRPLYSEVIQSSPLLPTEHSLFGQSNLRIEEYNGAHPLAVPKLNLQYLTLGDFLWRSFTLYRSVAFYEIRKHLEDTIKRLQPRIGGGITRFDGFSKMAIPIGKPAVIQTQPPRVGEDVPAEVQVEVSLDVSRLQPGLRREWESLRQDDVVYLLAVHPAETERRLTNGHTFHSSAEKVGLKVLRCAEVISVVDENGRMLRRDQDTQDNSDGYGRAKQRRLLLRLDAASYKTDKEQADAGKGDVYDSINLIVRRKGRENNFKPVLESIRQLTLAQDIPVPAWLQEVFLGFGDPSSASYKRLPNRLKSVDYRDTFIDWQHLIESLPGKTVEPDPAVDAIFPPPYVLEAVSTEPAAAPRPSKKRRRDQPDGPEPVPGYLNSAIPGEDRRAPVNTIDESVWETLRRDLLAVWEKMRQVLWPKYLLGGMMGRGGGIGGAERGEGNSLAGGVEALRGIVGRWPDADAVLQGGMSEGLRDWDLWGPLLFSLLLSFLLSLNAREEQRSLVFSGVFATIWIAEAVVTLQIKLLGGHISFFQSVCIIGYTLFPLVIASLLSALHVYWIIRIPVYSVLGLWSLAAGVSILGGSGVVKGRVALAVYPLFVFYLGLGCLCFIS
ncbi:hypothetical protein LTR94_008255 [Friedmanniomyces endolithicus]|nr:hypothetical protein LTR94_008255 [Friedmanniomyces endolithicus]